MTTDLQVPAASVPVVVPDSGRWCLVRFLEGRFCGPISPLGVPSNPAVVSPSGGFGFPDGGIGEIVTFATSEEAAEFASGMGNRTVAVDTPMPVSALHFSVEEHRYYDGKTTSVYDGGDFERALLMAYARRGQLASKRIEHEAKVTVSCRPKDAAQSSAP